MKKLSSFILPAPLGPMIALSSECLNSPLIALRICFFPSADGAEYDMFLNFMSTAWRFFIRWFIYWQNQIKLNSYLTMLHGENFNSSSGEQWCNPNGPRRIGITYHYLHFSSTCIQWKVANCENLLQHNFVFRHSLTIFKYWLKLSITFIFHF